MRDQWKINDEELVELVIQIFVEADQYWDDVAAFKVSKIIEAYIEQKMAWQK